MTIAATMTRGRRKGLLGVTDRPVVVAKEYSNVPLAELVLDMKKSVFRMAEAAGGGYVGQGLCAAEVVATLFFRVLRLDPANVEWEDRDRFILSVGHYAIAVYAAMERLGYFPSALLDTYSADGGALEMIATEATPGIEVGGGSLGQGLSQAIGLALSARLRKKPWRVYVLMSDGELEEGQTWEAAMLAAHYRLSNLTVIVDVNDVQADGFLADVTAVHPIPEKWAAFGWRTLEIDGNDLNQVERALLIDSTGDGRPTVIIARTKIGNGVSFLEGRPDIHYIRWNKEQTERAMQEIGGRMA
ncbi:MAG: transketolase [Alicyclobacillus sp.]|nr:transketolase [Alicyclobacillus sp.]